MNDRLRKLARRYAAILGRYLLEGREALLEEAYEVGRAAIAGGLGVLDMARVHEQARALLPRSNGRSGAVRKSAKAVETFFLQALSPFEAAHRGFRETNLKLRQLVLTLEHRRAELARMNRILEVEIRERERTKNALQTSEARLQAILDHSPAVIFLKDVHGRYLLVNRQFEHLFGRHRRQVIGCTDSELFPRAQAAAFRGNDRKVLRAGVPLEFEETARYGNSLHTSIVSKFPLRDARGKVYALCGIATDITGRKAAEEALRQSEERFRLLIANVRNYAIFLLRPDGCVASWNAGAERIKGYREDEILGRHFSCFYPAEDVRRGEPQRQLRIALRRGRFESEGWRLRRDGSRFWASAVITPVYDDAGRLRGFAKVTRDMTERKRTEEALRRSEEHYRQLFNEAQLMQENLRSLSNQILHVQEEERKSISRELHDEVGQHLTAISVMLATLRNNGAAPSEELMKKTAGIQRLLEAAMDSVHAFARELRPASLDELGLLPALRSCLKTFADRTGLRVDFRAAAAAESLGNDQKTALFRVAQESLTNVAKHADASRVDISLRKVRDGICMRIADNGKSFRDDPGNSARRKQRLGLLGMQERVRLVGGRFSIAPDPGEGTTVQVVVPLRAPRTVALPAGPDRPGRAGAAEVAPWPELHKP